MFLCLYVHIYTYNLENIIIYIHNEYVDMSLRINEDKYTTIYVDM